jgi:hypothetical protein
MVNLNLFLTATVFGILAIAAGWMIRKGTNKDDARRVSAITTGRRALGAMCMGLGLGLIAFAVSKSF